MGEAACNTHKKQIYRKLIHQNSIYLPKGYQKGDMLSKR